MKLDDLMPYAPYIVGVGVTLLVLLVLGLVLRGRKSKADSGPASLRSSEWQLPESSYADRRSAVRREGPPVKILISSPTLRTGVDRGYVLDRSTGGLRIAAPVGITPGTTLQVRAHNAPETTPWVTVIVRSCKPTGKHYELGCAFDQTPPWNVLLLFG